MKATITFKNDRKASETYKNVTGLHAGADSVALKFGDDQITLHGVNFVHAHAENNDG